MTALQELNLLDGLAQAQLVRQGMCTVRELVEAAIRRIEEVDAVLNTVTVRRFDQALAEVDNLRFGVVPGMFAGLPFLLKELGPSCAGMETTAGSAFLAGFVPSHDSELVRRLRRAGVTILGKTNTAEFGVLPTTEPSFRGVTRNPWALDRSPGGSSGGAAAAVAAGIVPIAHANDAGGSIRIPASCCGVVGLKPTRARTPLGPDVGDLMNGLAAEFVVSRSVRDSAAMLDLLAGPDVGDPYFAPPSPRSFLATALAGPDRPLRIGLVHRSGVHPDCVAAVNKAATLLTDLGHEVVPDVSAVTLDEVREHFLTVWAAGVSSAISTYAAVSGRSPRPELFENTTWWLYERGQQISAAHYLVTITRLQQFARRVARVHLGYDLLLSTVTAEQAPLLGTFSRGMPAEQLDCALAFALDAPIANLTGQPALSMPISHTNGGVPLGVQLTGRYGDDATVLALAGQLEAACTPQPNAPLLPRPSEPGKVLGHVSYHSRSHVDGQPDR
jgi:amidase